VDAAFDRVSKASQLQFESVQYKRLCRMSVSAYIAEKTNGSVKAIGGLAQEGTMNRASAAIVIAQAVAHQMTGKGRARDYIKAVAAKGDVLPFVSIHAGNGVYRMDDVFVGKVVRCYHAQGKNALLKSSRGYLDKTGSLKPIQDITAGIPTDIDLDAYVSTAEEFIDTMGPPVPWSDFARSRMISESGIQLRYDKAIPEGTLLAGCPDVTVQLQKRLDYKGYALVSPELFAFLPDDAEHAFVAEVDGNLLIDRALLKEDIDPKTILSLAKKAQQTGICETTKSLSLFGHRNEYIEVKA